MANIKNIARTLSGRPYRTPWPQKIAGAPKVTTNPTISGTIAPGQTVTAVAGVYTGTPTPTLLEREWTLLNSSGAVIDRQPGNSYAIPSDAPTGTLRLREVMIGKAALMATGVVEAVVSAVVGLPRFTSAPTISGSSTVGQTLTRVNGAATGSPAPTITGAWLRDGTPIVGQTGATYVTTSDDIGKIVSFRNAASNSVSIAAGLTITSTSGGITITSNPATAAVITTGPVISFNSTSGMFSISSISVAGVPTPTLTYQWYLADTATGTLSAREGRTGATWIPASDFYGKYVAVEVTASNGIGVPAARMSNRVLRPAQEGFTTAAALSGSAPRGSLLTLSAAWHGSPSEVEYMWFRAPSTGDPIRLSTDGTTRRTGADDETNTIKCRVRIKYASGAEFFSPSSTTYTNGILVTAAATRPVFPTAAATAARAVPNTSYSTNANGITNNAYAGPPEPFLAYATWQGATTDNRDRLVAAMKRNISASSNVDPSFKHGFSSQMELGFAGSAFFCKSDPGTWSQFTTDEKARIDTLMNLDAVTAATCARTGRSGESNNNMIGQPNYATEESGSNPNFRCAPRGHLAICAAYMGGGSALKDYLDDIESQDITDLYDALTDYGLSNAAGSIAPTGRPSGSPSYSHIVSKCHNFTTGGRDLTDLAGIWRTEMNFAYGKTAMTGLNGGSGSTDAPGRGKFGTSVSGYARYTAIDGLVGMIHEMDTNDEGGQRSSVRYSYWASYVTTIWTIVALASGQISRTDSANAATFRRMYVGNEFNQIATIKTWLETSHAREPSKVDASTWNTSKATTYGYVQRDALADVIDLISGNRT